MLRLISMRLVPLAVLAPLAMPAAAHAVDQTYTNPTGIYTVVIGDNGNYTAKTGPNHPNGAGLQLIFNGGGRNAIFSHTTSTMYPVSDLFSPKATISAIPNGVRASTNVGTGTDALHVDTDLTTTGTTMENSAVYVTLKVRNDGAAPVNIGARMAIDFKLANDDGPAFTPAGGSELTAATRYTNPAFGTFSLNDNNGTNANILTAPTLRTTWTVDQPALGTTTPDILEMADFGVRTLAPFVPSLPLANTKINRDNEVRYIFGPDAASGTTIAPGQTATYREATTMGQLNPGTPVNQTPPTITGTVAQGTPLAADDGAWSDTTGLTSFTRQWYRCDAQGANCAAISGATDPTYTPTASDLGSTLRIDVTAAGAAGPASSTVTAVVAAPDTTPPLAPTIGSSPLPLTASATASVAFTGAEAGGTFECRLDGGAWNTCTTPYVIGSLADGLHNLKVRQRDAALNTGAETSVSWTVDTSAPAVPALTGSPNATTTDTNATFAVSGEPGAVFEYQLDGGAWTIAGSPFPLSGLAVGAHSIAIRQYDLAGNVSGVTLFGWTVETPAAPPVAPTPTPTPTATPVAPVPTATPTATPVPPAPKFTASIGGQAASSGAGNSSGATTVTVQDKGVDVGCQMTGIVASCQVDLYADVDGAHAAARVKVGTGTVEADAKTNKLSVHVVLNAVGRELLRRSPDGLNVQVAITGQPVSGEPIKATGAAKLVAHRSTVVIGGFDPNQTTLKPAARRALTRVAQQLASGATVRVSGHTDGSTDDKRYLRQLGLHRAQVVKAFLAGHGAKADYTLVSRGSSDPRATNATRAGRALNRRVVLEIVR